MFHPVQCNNCKSDIGKYYVTSNKYMKKYINKVCIFKDAVTVNFEQNTARPYPNVDALRSHIKPRSEVKNRQSHSQAKSFRERKICDTTVSNSKDSFRHHTDGFARAKMENLNRAKSTLNFFNSYVLTDRKNLAERKSASKRRYKLRTSSKRTTSRGSRNEFNSSYKIFIHDTNRKDTQECFVTKCGDSKNRKIKGIIIYDKSKKKSACHKRKKSTARRMSPIETPERNCRGPMIAQSNPSHIKTDYILFKDEKDCSLHNSSIFDTSAPSETTNQSIAK